MEKTSIFARYPKLAILDAFETYMRDVRGVSASTVTAYLCDLLYFAEHLMRAHGLTITSDEDEVFQALQARAQGSDVALRGDSVTLRICTCSQEFLQSYLTGLLEGGEFESGTVARRLVSLRALYEWATERKLAGKNPALALQPIEKAEREPRILSDEEFDRLLAGVRGNMRKRLRDTAMLLLLHDAGPRASEIEALNEGHLQGSRLTIGQGLTSSRVRVRELAPRTVEALGHYLKSKSGARLPEAPLFTNKTGERMDTRSMRRHLDAYLKAAGLPLSIRPVDLRYTAIVNDLARGVPLGSAASLFGFAGTATLSQFMTLSQRRNEVSQKQSPDKAAAAPLPRTSSNGSPAANIAQPTSVATPVRTTSIYGRARPLQAHGQSGSLNN